MKKHPQFTVDHEIHITYDLNQSEVVTSLVDAAWVFAKSMGEQFQDPDWQRQVTLQVAVMLLGDLRFLEARGRTNYAIPLLGEGLRLIASLL